MREKKVMIFGKTDCVKCTRTKHKIGHYMNKWGLVGDVPVLFMDMDTPDGLAEGAFQDVLHVPTTIVMRGDGTVARWDGEVPDSASLRACLMP